MAYCPRCGTAVAPGGAVCTTCGLSIAAGPAGVAPQTARPAPAKKSKTPWIIGIAIGCGCLAVPLLGVISAIFIPNYLDAMHKGRMKRTMADLRQLQVALMAQATDRSEEESLFPAVESVEELRSWLEPQYLSELPIVDGWGHPLKYQCWHDNPEQPGCTQFRIGSPGRDGVFDYDDLTFYEEATFGNADFNEDLVVGMEGFVQYPEGSSGSND